MSVSTQFFTFWDKCLKSGSVVFFLYVFSVVHYTKLALFNTAGKPVIDYCVIRSGMAVCALYCVITVSETGAATARDQT